MAPSIKDAKPFAMGDTLRDLALLRSSDIDLSSLIPVPPKDKTKADEGHSEVEGAVEGSYTFVREARAAMRLHNRGDAEAQGKRVEEIRIALEEVHSGLE